jgi:VWFA-related protein
MGTVERIPTLAPRFTNDRRALTSAIERMLDLPASPSLDSNIAPLLRSHPLSSSQRGPSPIWDAVDLTVTALAAEPAHRAIVLLTDGHATGNRFSVTDVGRRAMLSGVSIHIVGARDAPYLVPQTATTAARVDPRTNLQWLARITGGSFSSMADNLDPQGQATRVMRELHSTYLLDIASAPAQPAGAIVPIEVRVNRPGVTVRTREGYGGEGR